MAKRTGILPPRGRIGYRKITQTKAGSNWFHRYAMAATPSGSGEKAFRHVWHRRGDRRPGEFRFKIIRDDGTIITHTLMQYVSTGGIRVYRQKKTGGYETIGYAWGYYPEEEPEDAAYWTYKNGVWYYERNFHPGDPYYAQDTFRFSYNTITQVWTVPFFDYIKVRTGNTFYAQFECNNSAQVRYAHPAGDGSLRYVTSDKFDEDTDYIRPKFYDVAVPYFKAVRTVVDSKPDEWPTETYCRGIAEGLYGLCHAPKVVSITEEVFSSVPYTVGYGAYKHASVAYYGHFYASEDVDHDCADVIEWAYDHWHYAEPIGEEYFPIHRPDWVLANSSDGDANVNFHTNPILKDRIVTPVAYTVEVQTHYINLTYVGPDPYILSQPCKTGNVDFPLEYRVFRADFSLDVVKNV